MLEPADKTPAMLALVLELSAVRVRTASRQDRDLESEGVAHSHQGPQAQVLIVTGLETCDRDAAGATSLGDDGLAEIELLPCAADLRSERVQVHG